MVKIVNKIPEAGGLWYTVDKVKGNEYIGYVLAGTRDKATTVYSTGLSSDLIGVIIECLKAIADNAGNIQEQKVQ